MSAPDTCTTPERTQVDRLRDIFDDADVLGMVYAETYRARRDNLPHDADAACLLTQQVPGCDGMCSTAVADVIDDVVGFYRRQLERGVARELDNPGGYARTIVRQRHLDVVRALTTPVNGYRRPERIADPAKQPAYLGLTDEIDGLLVSASMFYLRSAASVTDWERVCDHAEATCLRKGHRLQPGEGRSRLDRFVAAAIAAGGRAEEFVRRELLDLLESRSTTTLALTREGSTLLGLDRDAQHDTAIDRYQVTAFVQCLDEGLSSTGGWDAATRDARTQAVRNILGADRTETDLAEIVDLVCQVRANT